jgi:hypothetical protein
MEYSKMLALFSTFTLSRQLGVAPRGLCGAFKVVITYSYYIFIYILIYPMKPSGNNNKNAQEMFEATQEVI